jgi:hypothetical protein
VKAHARTNARIDEPTAELVARYAARLAGATTKGSWVSYAFELFTVARRPLPEAVVDELVLAVRRVKTLDPAPLRRYLKDLRQMAPSFGPAERQLMHRIERLTEPMA